MLKKVRIRSERRRQYENIYFGCIFPSVRYLDFRKPLSKTRSLVRNIIASHVSIESAAKPKLQRREMETILYNI